MTSLLQKPRCAVTIGAPSLNSRTLNTTLRPDVIDATYSRNSYLEADQLTISIAWREGGVDPRWLRNATCSFWLWDDAKEPFDEIKHLRFLGVCTKVHRKVSGDSVLVEMTFADYTHFFLIMKPFPTAGMPEWTDTLDQIWKKVCDNTGPYIPATKKIDSSVKLLRDNLYFDPKLLARRPEITSANLGSLVHERFHAIGKPTPKSRTDAWAVWNYCLTSLGLIGYIERDICFVTDAPAFFDKTNAPKLLYGENIYEYEEGADSEISVKGVVVQSFDPLTGRTLEAYYPSPGDERLKVSKAKARFAVKEGREVSANDESSEWIPYAALGVTKQDKLDLLAQLVYDEQHRQEVEGSLKTSDMTLYDQEDRPINILDLKSGDAIKVGIAQYDADQLLEKPVQERVEDLVRQGYLPDVAMLIASNLDFDDMNGTIFNIMSMEFKLGPEEFWIDIKYHSQFNLQDSLDVATIRGLR